MLQLRRPLTVNERILLQLSESGYQGGSEAPVDASQQGLANTLRLRLSHTSRALKALIVDGLVSELTGRVSGEVRRRKVYALTPSGSALAHSLSRQVGDQVVVVVSEHGSTEMTFIEAMRVSGGPHSLSKLLGTVRSDGSLHLEDLSGGEARTGPVSFARGRPSLALFFGRSSEEHLASQWITSGRPVLAVTGPAGVGKTAFASAVFESFPHPPHSFWYSFRAHDTRVDLLAALGGLLGALGKGELSARPEITDRVLEGVLARDLRDENVLLVLDDLDRGPALAGTVLAVVQGATMAHLRVLATCRTVPPWFSQYLPDEGLEIRLRGLAVEDAVRLLPPGLPEDEARALAELAAGNPRLLRFAGSFPLEGLGDENPRARALARLLRARDQVEAW